MEPMREIRGAIIDSWLERRGPLKARPRLVLQVAPRGCPEDLMIIEAEATLVDDAGWLEDLGCNLCHGSPIEAVGHLTISVKLNATEIHLAR